MLHDHLFDHAKVFFGLFDILIQLFGAFKISHSDLLDPLAAFADIGLGKEIFLAFHECFKLRIADIRKVDDLSSHKLRKLLVEQILFIKNTCVLRVVHGRNQTVVFHSGHVGLALFAVHFVELENDIVIISCAVPQRTAQHIKKGRKLAFSRFLMYGVDRLAHFLKARSAQYTHQIFEIHT